MIEIDDQKDPQRYYNIFAGLDFSRKIPDADLDFNVDFHAFWNGNFDRKPLLTVKSFFATQNTKFSKFNLWSRQDLSDHELLKPFKDKIVFRKWDPIEEAKGTVLENLPGLNSTDGRCWIDGDLFRLLVLHKYGGVYVDMDIVLLRNFAPLLQQEFMYKWGTEVGMINGAVMHMNKTSKLSTLLLEELKKRSPTPGSICWGNDVYVAVRNYYTDWTVFPAAMFNTEWQLTPELLSDHGFDPSNPRLEPFKKCKQSEFLYEGAFSWHWHGRWNEEIEQGSKWQILEEKIHNILKEKEKNED